MLALTSAEAETFGLACVMSGQIDKHSAIGISEVFCSSVLPKVQVAPINPAQGADVASCLFEGGKKSEESKDGVRPAVAFLSAGIQAETKAPIIMALIGENHYNDDDRTRTSFLWRTFNAVTHGERLIVLERGLKQGKFYGHLVNTSQQPIVFEEEMMGSLPHWQMASETCRTIIMAAYTFLCVAGGRQDKRSKLLIPIGQNHMNDFVEAFEYFAMNSKDQPWVRRRARGYFTMTSLGW